jgi:hypothetical protein
MPKGGLLGNDNAENDELLFTCRIEREDIQDDSRILIGRWGTGKTAYILLKNHSQSEQLKKDHGIEFQHVWFLNESTINHKSLLSLRNQYDDKATVIKAIEELWKLEILRTYSMVLTHLKNNFSKTDGKHWKNIAAFTKIGKSEPRVWDIVPEVIKAITSGVDDDDANYTFVNNLTNDSLLKDLNSCLRDIADNEIIPCIAIEPIDAPGSDLEKNGSIAQMIIDALLNTFRNHFEPSEKNGYNSKIIISIPWHRHHIDSGVDQPHKLAQYTKQVKWSKAKLKEFINRRLEYEIGLVKKNVSFRPNKDAWSIIFPDKIEYRLSDPPIMEDTFDYFLRHTHHRPRDLQTLVRKCIRAHATFNDSTVQQVLKEEVIKERVIKDTFRQECSELARYLIEEGKRWHPKFDIIANVCLKGMNNTFTTDELNKRIKDQLSNRLSEEEDLDFNTVANLLWDVGTIGLSIIPNNKVSRQLESIFTTEPQMVYFKNKNIKSERWNWFEYNYPGNLLDLKDKLELYGYTEEEMQLRLIVHPKLFEYFTIKHNDVEIPIGI